MKPNQKSKTPEQLFLGLTLGLAASLCILEYAKPWMGIWQYDPMGEDDSQFVSEMIPITFPTPQKPPTFEVVPRPVDNRFIIIDDVSEPKSESDVSDLPEFDFKLDDWFDDRIGVQPEIEMIIPFIDVRKKPEFRDLDRYLADHFRYPIRMKKAGIGATLGVQFTVGVDGKIREGSIEVLGSPNSDFTNEVIRVIKNMPAWIPGEQRGEKVAVIHTLPIRFRLR
jgi:periplasmic protein TonB